MTVKEFIFKGWAILFWIGGSVAIFQQETIGGLLAIICGSSFWQIGQMEEEIE